MVDPFLNGTTQITVIQKKPVYNKNTLINHLRFKAPLKSQHAAQNGFKNHSKFQFRVHEGEILSNQRGRVYVNEKSEWNCVHNFVFHLLD